MEGGSLPLFLSNSLYCLSLPLLLSTSPSISLSLYFSLPCSTVSFPLFLSTSLYCLSLPLFLSTSFYCLSLPLFLSTSLYCLSLPLFLSTSLYCLSLPLLLSTSLYCLSLSLYFSLPRSTVSLSLYFSLPRSTVSLSLYFSLPRSTVSLSFSTIGTAGNVEHWVQYQLKRVYEHILQRTACNMTYGTFGGRTCLGWESFFLLPGPLCYCSRTDTFLTVSSMLAVATDAETRQDAEQHSKTAGKRLTADWTLVLGEQALDLSVPSFSPSSSSIFVCGERNLYFLKDNRHILFMKKLEYNTSCFLPYSSVSKGTTNTLVGNHNNMLLVYQDVMLKWAAQLSCSPVAVRLANFPVVSPIFKELHVSQILLTFTLSGIPRLAQCKFFLPLRLVCCPSAPSKNAKYKITVDTNKPPVNLSEVFPDFLEKSEDKEGNALAFHFLSGPRVTVMASKTSQRYRIQSESFKDIWLVAKELVQRFDRYFAKQGVFDFRISFAGPLPLAEYSFCLHGRSRATQRRLLTRFKDKTPAPLKNLDTLMEGTYRQVRHTHSDSVGRCLNKVFVRLRSATHLLIILVSLWQGLNTEQNAILEATLLPLVQDTPQTHTHCYPWYRTHHRRSHCSKTAIKKAIKSHFGEIMPKGTACLKKHITLLCDRLVKGGQLFLASEANVPIPVMMPGERGEECVCVSLSQFFLSLYEKKQFLFISVQSSL
uniref:Uncharacterized protein n=1 Tax=Oncorhynchus tshawytscha TaxID=74940 RepID=A0AAZ3QQ77_ONCTS